MREMEHLLQSLRETGENSGNRSEEKSKPKRKRNIENDALHELLKLPGAKKHDLLNSLFSARIVTDEDPYYQNIITYVENSQNHGFKIKVLLIIRLVRRNDVEFEHDQKSRKRFRMMLLHGTKDENVLPILNSGFAQPSIQQQMFGTGVYFADRASKSAQYCSGNRPGSCPRNNSIGHMFLCDVLVGKMYTAKNAHNEYTVAPVKNGKQCDSVRCVGANIPDPNGNAERQKPYDAVWPIGKTIKNTKFKEYSVRYNEYVVYTGSNIKPKYLLKLQFN